MTDTPKPELLRRLPLVVILIVAVLGAFLLRDYLSFETLRDNREHLLAFRNGHFALTVLGFVVAYVLIVAFSLPGATVATLSGGFLFGTAFGTVVNVTAATIGATAIFLAARHGLGDRLGERLNGADGAVKRIKAELDQNQWSMLFLMRLVPAVPFFVANLLPAFLNVSLYRYVVSTFLGIIPGGLVFTSIGAGLGEVFEAGDSPNLSIVFAPHILLPILGLCVLAALPVAINAWRGRTIKDATHEPD